MECVPDYGWLPTVFAFLYMMFGYSFGLYGVKSQKIKQKLAMVVICTFLWPVFMIGALISCWRDYAKESRTRNS